MRFANDYDRHRFQQRFNNNTGFPVLGRAADNLAALADWADQNSDGFHSWPKPLRAAQGLIALLEDAEKRERESWSTGRMADATTAELTAALRPVKAFLTRQGVQHAAVLL